MMSKQRKIHPFVVIAEEAQKKVYRMMRGRRGYMSEDTAVKIRKMLSEGYTHAVIVATLHVTPSQVEYQQSKRKAGLV